MAQDKNCDRRVLHCLICLKPTEVLTSHLSRVCMKNHTPEERQLELKKAKESTKAWTCEGRSWDYLDIFKWCPHVPSRQALVRELKRRGFFVLNCPPDLENQEAEETTVPEEEQPSTSAAPPPHREDHAEEGSPTPASEAEGGSSSDPTWQRSDPEFATSLRVRMQEENLYAKFPPEASLLKKFKHHLESVLQIPNCQHEVDNVSRMLRYMQPTGNEVNLDFLQNTSLVGDYFDALRRVGQSAATRINYLKSMLKFIKFIKLEHGASDPDTMNKCTHYMEFLSVLRKPISKTHSRDLCSKRHEYFVGPKVTVHTFQQLLREAKKDALVTYGRLLSREPVTEEQKMSYRYYCEAILLLGHFQRPGAVDGLTVTEWLQKELQRTGGRGCQVPQEGQQLIDQYYTSVQPDHVKDLEDEDVAADRLFLGRNGKPLSSATNDLRRLHEQ
ncbi:uncharacterized protein LOC121635075 [Melanotaenia boesemani]|uniref:uncharacterized protein LOC121635075 n=1 Tax=Melanotaenia boesemani TaxID=1250792 RepID=UPI001C03EDD5|nr:uncharacterized protein LOC121635075 [Melanotaenia boesemani]